MIYYFPKTQDHLPFIQCTESDNSDSFRDAATKCANKLKINLKPIYDCMNSTLGNSLEHQNALLTEALDPPHNYVPWGNQLVLMADVLKISKSRTYLAEVLRKRLAEVFAEASGGRSSGSDY